MISIIIPVYNAVPYLEKCLSSVSTQHYTDWECILVDDGSTDGSLEICNKWSMTDNRFKVIHQTNKGVSVARNRGLEKSKGEYIIFVDSDDWVDNNYLFSLINGYSDESIDLVVTGTYNWKKDNVTKLAPKEAEIRLCHQQADIFISNINFHYGPISKLFKSDIIKLNNIHFPEDLSLGEDLVFNFHYLEYVRKVKYIPTVSYYYIQRESGSLVTAFHKDRFDIHYSQWILQKEFLERHQMWNSTAKNYLYNLLWAHVYEGLFVPSKITRKAIHHIFSVEEIDYLKEYEHLFHCSKWIKFLILHKLAFPLWCARYVKEFVSYL